MMGMMDTWPTYVLGNSERLRDLVHINEFMQYITWSRLLAPHLLKCVSYQHRYVMSTTGMQQPVTR